MKHLLLLTLSTSLMAACTVPSTQDTEPKITQAQDGRCYSSIVTQPAIIETTTQQIPLDTGGYETRQVQNIIRPREEIKFQAICPTTLTPDFIASLQRALAARSLAPGPITGTLTPSTRDAVQRFQSQLGLGTAVLTHTAAVQLGLTTTR